jgi:Tfp pilus assembly protein PilV
MKPRKQISTVVAQQRKGERGSMLIELLISMVVLAIGLGGVLAVLVSSVLTNSKSGKDTTSTMVAEHVLEQISAQPANAVATLSITDCAGTAWNIATAGAALGAGSSVNGGNGANLTNNAIIDWTQAYAGVPVDYKMQYVSCGTGNRQVTYDVRWNVIQMTNYTRMTIVSARPANSNMVGGLKFVVPVNLRTIGGM